MKIAQLRHQKYANKRQKPLQFKVGDMVMLKVSLLKGIIHFGKRGKLSPRFIEPFQFFRRIGKVAYRLDLPQELQGIHNVFHISYLIKTLFDKTQAIPMSKV